MTRQQYVNLILNNGDQLIAKKNEFEIPAISSLQGDIGIRVHNRGQDDNNETRAYKNKAYKKRNKKKDPVRMVLKGDLLRDYGIYTNGKDNVLGFRDDLSIKKILGEEERRSGKLFSLKDEEINDYRRELMRYINRIQKLITNV